MILIITTNSAMLLEQTKYKFKMLLFALFTALVRSQIPGVGVLGGTTNCGLISGCQQSYYCDMRCAPVTSGQTGTVLRWCRQNNTNYECCCGCTNVVSAETGNQKTYFWYQYDNNTCASFCPGGYYPPDFNASGYACQKCDYQCNTCKGSGNLNCTTCASSAYQLGTNACYGDMTLQYPALTSDKNPCPAGYYGLQITKVCVACPTGTYICTINLASQMPYPNNFGSTYGMNATNCTGNGDVLCSYTLKAFACNVGYTLVNGWCFPNTQCMLYSYYNSNAGGSFSSSNCLCYNGFEQQSAGSCLRCPINCATCSGGSCATCPTGASGSSCGYNTSYYNLENWVGVSNIASLINCVGCKWTTNVAAASALVSQKSCPSSQYVFGYYGYYNQGVYTSALAGSYNTNLFPDGATLSYNNPAAFTGKNHYGVHFRATLLFIDSWTNGKSIAFTQGGLNRFEYYYKMQGIVGEYLCGYNTQDHLDLVDGTFEHDVDLLDLKIFATSNGLMWGIKQILIQAILCNSMCATCNGPSALQCLTCSDVNREMVGGVCKCNSTAGYYMAADNSGCVQNCTTSIQDPFTYSCVSTCNFPNYFIFTNATTGDKKCVIDCPDGYYKKLAGGVYTCVDDCYITGAGAITTKYFNFNSTGSGPTCFNVCPAGTYGDPMTHSCVTKCSAYNSSTVDGYFGYNSYCYQSCPSGWAYHVTRLCLSSCPTGYYKNFLMKATVNSSICQQKCSITLKGQYKYGDNTTGYCTSYCATDSYGDIATNLCLDVCNSTSYGQSITTSGVTQRLCVQNCSTNLYGNLFTGLCVNASGCPSNYYADPLTFICTLKCTGTSYFGDNKTCVTARCNNSYFRQNDTKICVQNCFNNNSFLDPQWGDSTSGYCVASCYGAYFGDPQKNNTCTDTCSSSPSPTFGLDNLCVLNCSNVTWADPFHPHRICTTSCTSTTADSYGYNTTRTCVLNCPDGEFAHNVSGKPLCVLGCTENSGLFGNILNNRCQAQCPSPYYGDVTGNRTCILICPSPYYASNCSLSGSTIVISPALDRVCRLDCTSCGWADNSSRTCAWTSAGCENGTYAHETNHRCVIPSGCTGFADPVSRYCIPLCLNNSAVIYFGDPSTKKCVQICPLSPNLFGDNATRTCNLTCSGTYVRDWQYLRRCVNLNACSRTPVALFGDSVKALCVVALNCSDGYYGDNSTNVCKQICPGSTLRYADNVTKQCVAQCSLGWYALNLTAGKGVCSEYCPLGQWADNFTVKCTNRCSPLTYGINVTGNWTTLGSSYIQYGVCQNECPDGMFARNADNLCVNNCGDGGYTNIWGDTLTKTCVVSPFNCSEGYYADDDSFMCVVPLDCSEVGGVQFVADNLTNKCVNKCPSSLINYADMDKFLCVARCPPAFYGYNSTLECVQSCEYPDNSTYDGSYADPQLNICVQICSSQPQSLFGENDTFTCVEARYCPADTWAEDIVYNRQCRPHCAAPNTNGKGNAQQYSDNLTFSCVTECPTYSYADLSTGYGECVYVCPNLTNNTRQFADNSTKKCVTVCPSGQSTFGDNVTRSCVITCPNGSFAQTVPSRYCVAVCSTGTWGETIKNTCVTSPKLCPTVNGSMYYAENISTMCVKKCPAPTNTTAGSWGENTTQACLSSCTLPTGQSGFMWNLTRVCIDICPAQIGVDGSYSDQGMCYYTCMTNNTYRDPQNKRSCQTTCSFSPIKQYADDTTYRCVAICPTYPELYYSYDSTKQCVQTCPNSYRKLQTNRSCVATCPNTTYFNPDTYQCVATCPLNTNTNTTLFGDPTTTEKTCVTNSNCPNHYYADSNVGLCVSNCTNGQWIHGKDCVAICPNGYYGNPDTLTCVVPADCPSNYFADNSSVSCVQVCPGSFGFYNKTCLLVCPIINSVKYYADSVTHKCATSCTFNSTIKLYMNDINQTCVSQCSPNLFLDPLTFNCTPTCSGNYYADNSTRTCVSVCPATPPLFGQNKTYTCVEECLNVSQFQYVPKRVCVYPCPIGYFMENNTRNCVTRCPNLTYADTTSGYCVSNCSSKFAYDGTNTCQSMCPEPYFADPTTYLCLFHCPNYPTPYFQVVQGNSRTCDTSCPGGQFRDFTSYVCTANCPLSPPTFADTTTGSCLSICSTNYYANNATRTCMTPCPPSMFADPNTRTCVAKCDPQLGFYGDSNLGTPACVAVCSSGRYADDYTQTCVSGCRNFPKMYAYDNGNTTNPIRVCVYSCPYPWVADNATGRCYLQCNHAAYPYLDLASKACVANCSSILYHFAYMPLGQTVNGQCVQYCPRVGSVTFFSLRTNNTCVTKCPNGMYGSTGNNSCEYSCNLGDNFYADPANNLCTLTCTSNGTYFSYADEFSRKCVTACPAEKGMVGDRQIWKCVNRCSNLSQFADLVNGYCATQCPPGYFADNTTQTCISNCSIYTLMYGDINSRVCVPKCSLTNNLYADDNQRLCVNATNCSAGLFGFNTTRVCVSICPTSPNLFGDPLSRTCVSVCPNSSATYFADPVSRICVRKCPEIPALFQRNNSQTCVDSCPANSYADNYTRYCIAVCSIVGVQTFADNSTNLCVKKCPTSPNYYASNYTWQCVFFCPTSPPMYADNSTRSCVFYCPGGIVNTYADDLTGRCVDKCPNLTYNQNSTRQCLEHCLTGFADPNSKYCIAICPNYWYADNNTNSCVAGCPIVSGQQTYAEDGNNYCMSNCLLFFRTYADPYTKRCVKVCPISQGYFADGSNVNNRTCVSQCSPGYNADYSTRTCVQVCPSLPALFAINTSRICTAVCPNNSWSDNSSRMCLAACTYTNDTYGQNSTWACVSICPMKPNTYADYSTHLCVPVCPPVPDLYADNITRRCVLQCPNHTYADSNSRRCVTTCPEGWFGQNSSRRCVTACPWRQFADELLNLCVQKCSVDPIYYGNPDNLICVTQCPSVNNSFGNPLTQECVDPYNNGTANLSGCPIAYFADSVTRLCVQVCPMGNDTYGDNSTWKCVTQCPAGTINTFADNSTMRCVKVCPTYPDYYAEPFSRRCVHYCLAPNGTFSGSFSENYTRTCTQRCPSVPDFYSDNSTGRCVFYCSKTFDDNLTFADAYTRRCVDVCPANQSTFGDPLTLRCVSRCPQNQSTFADPVSQRCVKTCPSTPPLYADNFTQACISACIYNNSYADNHTRRCVAVCPRYPDTYGDYSTNSCVLICPPAPDLYADPISQTCVPRCQQGFFAQNTTRRCLTQCPTDLINWADDQTRRCVLRCPANLLTWGDNETQRCVSQCPLNPFTYADNVTQTCVKICNNVSTGGFADNISRVCVSMCPDDSYGDITTRYCVRYCPVGWYAYNITNLCVQDCPSPYFADNTTWMCVEKCPVGQNLFGETINNTCVPMCPEGTYSSDQNQRCVTRCPNSSQTTLHYDTFGENTTNDCVSECPIPLYGYPVAQVCVDVCPDPYYQNITDHRCYACPEQCATCNAPYLCLTCNPNHYLYSGACVESCPTFPVITYANPNRVCGTASQCTQGFYALNSTKSCVSTCPAGYFVDVAGQSCAACMKGCVSCTSTSSCLACNIQVATWSNYTCYMYCSVSRKYYTAKGCVGSCPAGSYLSLTTCQSCSSVCKTCQVTAQNCLVCANGYYRSNGICVSQCPSGTIAQVVNKSQTCVSCSVVKCTTAPLTFTTSQFMNNYQYNVQVQFSEAVNITQQIDKVIQIQQTGKKRILATTFQYLDYTIIDYGNGLYVFVLNNYDPSSGSNIEVQITNPSAILSASGQMPQTTRSSLQVNTANLYSLDYYQPAFDGYLYGVAILAFILLLFTFGTHQSIWMPMFDLLQILMSLILVNVIFPPNLLYSIRSCFVGALTFLPNFFSRSFQQAAFSSQSNNDNIYSLMQDGSFLRVLGPLYFIVVMVVVVMLVVLLLSKKAWRKDVKNWAKSFVRQTFWKKHLHGLVYFLFLPTMILGLYDMSIYSYLGTSAIQIFSIISSYFFMILFLTIIIFFTYRLRKLAKDSPTTYLMIQKAFNFVLFQKIVLPENKNHYFVYEKNEVDLSNLRQPRINQLLIFPYQIQTTTMPMQLAFPLISYLHKFMTAVFLVISFSNPVIQIVLLILGNIAFTVYIIVKRPFFSIPKREFNNQMYIHNLVVITLIQIVLLVLVVMYSQLDTASKVLIGNIICGLILYVATINLIYLIHRTYRYYHQNVWKRFVRSQVFRLNYVIQHIEWTKQYEKQENKLMAEVKTRAEFLQAIKIQNGEALANMVMKEPSIAPSTKEKMKSLQLRPNKAQMVSKQYGQLFTHIANDKQKSQKSLASSERMSKNNRKKVRDTIFGQKEEIKNDNDDYKRLELIDEKGELQGVSRLQVSQTEEDKDTEYEYQYIQEEYPEGTPMQEIMKGCAKGDVVLPM